MWRSKKVIVSAVLAAVLVFGIIGGVALADNGDGGLKAKCGDFITSVCDIYDENVEPDIDREVLKAAIDEVRTQIAQDRAEMRAEAMENRLVLTDEQKEALQEWLDDMPEDLPFGPGLRGCGGFRGMGGMRWSRGPCAPE